MPALTLMSALEWSSASKVGGDGVCGTIRGRTLILALSALVAGVVLCRGSPGLRFCARRFRGGVVKLCIWGINGALNKFTMSEVVISRNTPWLGLVIDVLCWIQHLERKKNVKPGLRTCKLSFVFRARFAGFVALPQPAFVFARDFAFGLALEDFVEEPLAATK